MNGLARSFARSAVITDGGRGSSRSALACARALADAGIRPLVTVSEGGEELAAVSKWAERVEVHEIADELGYRTAIPEIAEEAHLPVFATSDGALVALDLPGSNLTDKAVLATRAAAVGIDVPPTVIVAGLHDLDAAMAFPVVVKPVVGSSPAIRLDVLDEAVRVPTAGGPLAVQPYVDDEMTAIAGVGWDGALVATVRQRYIRRWPVAGGTASAAITTEHDASREASLVSLLEDHQGIFHAQYVGSWLIDLNPRPFGSMPLAVKCGVNLSALVCALAVGEVGITSEVRRGRTGRYRWFEGDVRHVVARLRAGSIGPVELLRVLTPRRGTVHGDVSVRDPRPALLRGRQIIQRARHRDDR